MMAEYKDLFNFRDLGGLTTSDQRVFKTGWVYRTGNISHLTEKTARYLAQNLKIKTYIDFRGTKEIDQFGHPTALKDAGIDWLHLPIDADDPDFAKITHPKPEDWVQLYVRLFEKNQKSWAHFLNFIRDSNAPLMYGCLFGKDRTGIGTGLLLHHLGIVRDQIVHDYSKTTQGLFPNVVLLKKVWESTRLSEDEVLEHYLKAHPEILNGFLDHFLDRAAHSFNELVGGQTLVNSLSAKLLR